MKSIVAIISGSCILLLGASLCFAKFEKAGFVKCVSGDVYIPNSQVRVAAVLNMKILPGDSIQTGMKSSVGLVFDDDSVLSLGPESDIMIEDFLFNPVEKKLSFIARMIKGTFSFISGQIARLAPEKVIIETPDATLGVRGTKILIKID